MSQELRKADAATKRSASVVICNVWEFNRRFETQRDRKVGEIELYSQLPFALRGLSETECLVAVHERPSAEVLAHWADRLGFRPEFLTCPPVTGELSTDILRSEKTRNRLRSACGPNVKVSAWGQTARLEALLKFAGQAGSEWQRSSASLVDLFDAKVCNRGLVDHIIQRGQFGFHANSMMVSVSDRASINSAVSAMLSQWEAVVVKPGATWGGKGTTSVSREEFAVRGGIIDDSSGQSYSGGYYVLEPLLGDPRTNVSPSVDWMPNGDGSGQCYVGSMVMDGFRCSGTMYGRGSVSLSARRRSEIVRYVKQSAAELHRLGYSGWFDADFLLVGRDAYVNEFNIRHTGGTVPILVAQAIFGRGWEQRIGCVEIDGVTTRRTPAEILRKARQMGYNAHSGDDAFVLIGHRVFRDSTRTSFWLSSADPEKARADSEKFRRWLI